LSSLLQQIQKVRLLSLSKKKGIHHIAFDVEDIVAEIARLQKEGFIVLNEIQKKALTTS
jgi:4-hydroxyphenylpyruvate dioxygenase-like putative hemolysin